MKLQVAVAAAAAVAVVRGEGSTEAEGIPLPACGFAVDLAYLRDYSASFEEDKQISEAQLVAILNLVEERYPETRFGLGTFVDKPLLNFGYPYVGPWFEGDWCLNVTHTMDNQLDVSTLVAEFFSSPDGGGNDWPENQLGAMLDAAKGPLMKWSESPNSPNGRPIIKIMVMSTEAPYHIAGDGLNSVHALYPNNGDGETVCDEEDYPSIAQVSDVLKEKDIYTVFLVGNMTDEDTIGMYEELLVELDVPGGVYEVKEGTEGLIEAFIKMFEDIERVYCEQTMDIVFAQDVTSSYNNDAPNFRGKMEVVSSVISSVFEDSRFAFTTFGDKPIYPFGHAGSGDYCFAMEIGLTTDVAALVAAADAVQMTSGIDWKESQLDGMMSSVVAPGINWRSGDFDNGKALIRVVALATDSGYHVRGDGAEEGYTLIPHLQGVMTDALCTTQEYPSILHLAETLDEEEVYPIFVPTGDIMIIYQNLAATLEAYGISSVVINLDDFGNLAEAVAAGAQQLAAKVSSRRVAERFQKAYRMKNVKLRG